MHEKREVKEIECIGAYNDSYFTSTMMLYRDRVSLLSGRDSGLV